MSQLEGVWFQAAASRATDIYGCLQYQFVNEDETDTSGAAGVNINASWTAFNTWWNPLQKGQFAKTYELYGDVDGRLFERSALSRAATYSRVLATDYSTYFVEYACKQTYLDFWTIEYVDVFTKDGLMDNSSLTLAEIQTLVTPLMPNFDSSDIVAARSANGCPYQAVWGIF